MIATNTQKKLLYLSKSDVEGSKPKKLFVKSSFVGNLNVRDINEPSHFKSHRNSNPLDPTYDIYNQIG
jgi:hypothetical protein